MIWPWSRIAALEEQLTSVLSTIAELQAQNRTATETVLQLSSKLSEIQSQEVRPPSPPAQQPTRRVVGWNEFAAAAAKATLPESFVINRKRT